MKNAMPTDVDTQGRILLPLELLQASGMQCEDKVMVIGVGDFAEIWPYDLYCQMSAENDSSDLMAALEEVDI